jgi:WD40 repeat protein
MKRIFFSMLVVVVTLLSGSSVSAAVSPSVRQLTTDNKSLISDFNLIDPTHGRVAYYRRASGNEWQLVVWDPKGKKEYLVDKAGGPACPNWSPDGEYLGYTWAATGSSERSVQVWHFGDRQPKTLTKSAHWYSEITWAPNSALFAARKWYAEPAGHGVLLLFDVKSGRVKEVTPNILMMGNELATCSWAPDSSWLAFEVYDEATHRQTSLWSCRADGSGLKRVTPSDCKSVSTVEISPDGQWIAFTSHYKRSETENGWCRDIWLIRPDGSELHPLTHGSSSSKRSRFMFSEIYHWTKDGRYILTGYNYPDPVRTESCADGLCYVDAKSGEVIHAVGDDISSPRVRRFYEHDHSCYWRWSADASRVFFWREEADYSALASADASPVTTWQVATVFDLKSRKAIELARLELKGQQPLRFCAYPSFSPDGSLVYFSLKKVVSEEQKQYDYNVYCADLGLLFDGKASTVPPTLTTAAIETTAPLVAPEPVAPSPSTPVVDTQPAPTPEPIDDSAIVRFPVQNITAAEALTLLPAQYQGVVKVDVRRNCLLVSAPPAVREALARDLTRIDIAAPQIAVDVLVVELSQQGAKDLGLDVTAGSGHWATLFPVGETSRLGLVDGDGIPLLPSTASGLGEVIYQGVGSLPKQFFAHLSALTVSGNARIHASPTVVTTSGKEASIVVRQRVNFFYNSGYDVYGRPNLVKSDISADINVKLTPLLLGNSQVNLEVDALVGSFTFKGNNPLPDTTDRQVTTALTVPQGQTMVLGGLKQRQESMAQSKVPLLGDLPLIGSLFRKTSKRSSENTLTIMITPRVVTPGRLDIPTGAGESDPTAGSAAQ